MGEDTNTSKKVVTLETLKAAVDKIQADYPTKTAVMQQISQASMGAELTYATTEEVLALFQDSETP